MRLLTTRSARNSQRKSTSICNWKTRTQVFIVRGQKSTELSPVLGEEQRQKVKSAGSSRPLYRDFTLRVTQSVVGDRNQELLRFSRCCSKPEKRRKAASQQTHQGWQVAALAVQKRFGAQCTAFCLHHTVYTSSDELCLVCEQEEKHSNSKS